MGFKFERSYLSLELSTQRSDLDSTGEELTSLWEWNWELMRELANSIDKARCSNNDLSTTIGELAKLQKRHSKFREDYREPIESLRKAHDLAIRKDIQLRERREELAPA